MITTQIKNECTQLVAEYFNIHLGEQLVSCGYMADDGDKLVICEAHTSINDPHNYRVEVDSNTFTVIRVFELLRNEHW